MTAEWISRQRCFNHASREAAARCPECGRFFCRECVTEHDDRVICASCLAKLLKTDKQRKSRLGVVVRGLQLSAAIVMLWLFFYVLGEGLLALPTSFHEGNIWHTEIWEP